MSRYINPFTDWGFKKIFGQEANKDIIIFFLNEMLKGERVIEDITFLDKERLGEEQEDRSLIYDIYCLTDTGEHIIVEMQNKRQPNFMDRSLFYMSKSIVEQAHKGDTWKYEVTAVYGVFFLNFLLEASLDNKLRTDIILADRETGRQVSDKMRLVFLQLPHFNKTEDECENNFERVIYVLKKMTALERMPFEKKIPFFKRLAEIAEVRTLTDNERMAYDESLKKYRDNLAVYDGAIAAGMEVGIEEGMKKGMEKGMKKGMEKGMEEGRTTERLHNAISMKKNGISYELIYKITGLTEADLNKAGA